MRAAQEKDDALAWLRLAAVADLPVPLALRAAQAFGGVAEALAAPRKELAQTVGSAVAERMRAAGRGAADEEAEAALAWLEQHEDAALLPITDPLFPSRLIHAGTAPLVLFIRGNAEALRRPMTAVAGTLRPDEEGALNAAAFAEALSRAGQTVTAALEAREDCGARALEGALAAGGAPIALLASGPDRAVLQSAALQRRVLDEGGLLIAQAFPGTSADERTRGARDALLATAAPRLLIIEALRNDPVLRIARQAAEAGAWVGAIPGSIHSPLSKGCHRLIREGAALAETLEDMDIRPASGANE